MMSQLDLLRCPPPPKMPPGPIIRDAEFDATGRLRWTLRRAWGPGPSILWCGTNPSMAGKEIDDPTMLREIGFSFRWGYGSLVKINVWPFVSPDPKKVDRWRKTQEGIEAWHANVLRARDEIAKVDVCVAAWGNSVPVGVEQEFISALFWDHRGGALWKCLGLTASGSPKHTLARGRHRIPDDAVPVNYAFPEEGY